MTAFRYARRAAASALLVSAFFLGGSPAQGASAADRNPSHDSNGFFIGLARELK